MLDGKREKNIDICVTRRGSNQKQAEAAIKNKPRPDPRSKLSVQLCGHEQVINRLSSKKIVG